MYSLDVNFLKDRITDVKKTSMTTITAAGPSLEKQLPMYIGAGVMILLPALAGLSILLVGWQKAQTQESITTLEAELARLKAQNQKVQELETKAKAVEADVAGLVGVFDQIKPWSAILQDLTDQTPPGIQLSSIQQTGKALTLTGFAGSYASLNDFMLMLTNSQFLKADETKLTSATAAPLPISGDSVSTESDDPTEANKTDTLVQVPQGVKYTITTTLSDTPDQALLPELIRKGAIGLVTRFKTLEQKGILKPLPAPGASPSAIAPPVPPVPPGSTAPTASPVAPPSPPANPYFDCPRLSPMTFTEDYTTTQIFDTEFDANANYPTAFGITFTPQITGIGLGVLGLVGSFYVLFTFFLPAWDEFQKLKTDEAAKQQEVDTQKAG
ncbi:MAG: PilN domain-containing protein, partial [Microcystaceae cyanobacterium]